MARTISGYPFLVAGSGVNWQDVSPDLLGSLNRLGMKLGKLVTLTSGYRSDAEQVAIYQSGVRPAAKPESLGGGGSNHSRGLAVDALIDGKPVGSAVSPQLLAKVGLRSLKDINDPVHIELLKGGKPTTPGAEPSPEGEPTVPSAQDVPLPEYGQPPVGPLGISPAGLPIAGSVDYVPRDQQWRAQTWNSIAQQPNASPDTLSLAELASR